MATPSLQLGSGNWAVKSDSLLGYALPQGKYTPREFTVTRATTATRVNETGLVQLVPYNLFSWSQSFDNAAWLVGGGGPSVFTNNFSTAPDGTATASRWTAANLNSQVRQNLATINTPMTISVWMRTNTGTKTAVLFINDSEIISNITVTTSWQRFTLSGVVGGTLIGSGRCGFSNNSILTTSDYIEVWGAQLVQGTNALTYLPTTTRLNIPRIDYSTGSAALLVEPQRTNLCLSSNSIGGTSWGAAYGGVGLVPTITLNYATAPDGTTSASRLQLSLGGGTTTTDQSLVTQTLTATSTRGSFYIKTTDGSTKTIYLRGSSAANIVVTGTWTRYDFDAGTLTGTQFGLGLRGGQTPINSNTVDILVWGAQLEVGAYPTSYIPTTSASVTRNEDIVTKSGISALIGQNQGTLYSEFIFDNNIGRIIAVGDNTTSNRIFIGRVNVNQLQLFISIGGVLIYNTSSINSCVLGRNKVAVRYNSGDISFFLNGVLQTTSNATFSTAALSTLFIAGSEFPSTNTTMNKIITSNIYKEGLSNAELITLTTL